MYVIIFMYSGTIIQGRQLFKGGNYYSLDIFDRGNYSKEETIQGRKLYEEIRYTETKG